MLRTGAEYLESLRDGREVWLGGQRVDVTTHPLLAPCAHAIAEVYDLQHDPAHRALLTMPSPDTGEPVSAAWRLPRTTEDLVKRRAMIELLMRRCGATLGRLPEYMATILMGLYNAGDLLAQGNPAYPKRVEAYLAFCREQDLCLSHGFTDPPRDHNRPASDMEYLHVVARDEDGIVIRGAKAVATIAPYANDYVGLTAHRPDLQPEEVLYFGVPIATPGLRLVCRESFTHPAAADHALSAAYDEMDAWVVFDDVRIPNERIFFLDRVDLNQPLFTAIPSAFAFHHILTRQAVKAEVLAGICVAVADYLGTTSQPATQAALAELIGYLETLRAFLFAAEQQATISACGLMVPSMIHTIQGRIHGMERHPAMLQLVRDVCGSSILMAPGQADLDDPAIGVAVRRYLAGADPRAEDRFRLLKLAWEYAGDSFGSRQLMFELFNGGTLAINRARLLNAYDTTPLARLAKELAGIPTGAAPLT